MGERTVDIAGHLPAESIDFPNQMGLAGASDAAVAGHGRYRVQILGHKSCAHTKSGASEGGLTARVAAANHNNVEIVIAENPWGHARILHGCFGWRKASLTGAST